MSGGVDVRAQGAENGRALHRVSELARAATKSWRGEGDPIDYKGDKAIQTVSDGPIFFANPAPGRWIIEAELDGETFTKTVDVNGRFYVTFDFRFKGQSR